MKIRWMKHIAISSNEGNVFIYNTITEKLRNISQKEYDDINAIIQGKMIANNKYRTLIADLYDDYYLVNEEYNETKEFMKMRYQSNFCSEQATIYYIPTFVCNFRCSYCFEQDTVQNNKLSNLLVSDETIYTQILWIKNWVIRKKYKKLKIVFFGGEPMIGIKQILLFMNLMQGLSDTIKIEYSMITNGYLITKNNAGKLKEHGLSYVQITIDGPQFIHDQRRICANGDGSFDRIIKNIDVLLNEGIGVVIRINIDEKNGAYIVDLLRLFKQRELQNKIRIVIAPVDPDIKRNFLGGNSPAALSYLKDIYQFMAREKFMCVLWKSACGYGRDDFICISPDGNLYACPRMAGIEKYKIGNIKKGVRILRPRISLLKKECRECEFLGICVGGCDANTIITKKHFCLKETYSSLINAWAHNNRK